MRPLRAKRYLTSRNTDLAAFITTKLHDLDYDEAMAFYRAIESSLRREDLALLGCNDRFFLLVGLLDRTDMRHPWIYNRCREVEADPDGHLDLWARYHMKSSSITTGGVVQEVLGNPELTVAIFSNNQRGANKFVNQIKQYFQREGLKSIFPDVLWQYPSREAPRWSENGLIVRRNGNPKEATVEGHGLINGMPTGGHWQLLVYDDLVTEVVAKNPEMVRKAIEQWELSTNLGVGEGTRTWMIGTRYSYGDPYGTIMQRGIKPRIYPATDDGTLNGKPVLYSQSWWEKIKLEQRGTVAAQMLQNPLAGKENTFMPQWFNPWHVRPSVMNVYIMCDPQKGSSSTSDRTAIAVVGIDSAGVKYLIDGFRHRMALSDRWVAVRDLYAKWSRMPGVGLCEVGYERYGEKTDEEYFRRQMLEGNHTFTLKILNWVGGGVGQQSKKARVERLEPDFRNGRFLLPGVVFSDSRDCYWRYDGDSPPPPRAANQLNHWPVRGPMSNMKRAMEAGNGYLCAKPITRRDEDGRVYDVTLALRDEMLLFPFAPKDDLVDAVSRIYDMDAVTPSVHEDRDVERLNRAFEEVA